MKITREIKTAILVIASILLFIWGYSFLKGRDLFVHYRTFYAKYDNVEGLAASAPVTINGLVVGKVTAIMLDPVTAKPTVEIQVKSDFPISKSSEINIYEPGLIGGKQIQIIPNLEDKSVAESGEYLKGRTVPGLTALVGEKLTPLQEKLERVIVSADTMVTSINKVLDAKSRENLRKSIASLSTTLEELNGVAKGANGIITDNREKIAGTMKNLNKAAENFNTISDSISKIKFGQTVKKLENALTKVDGIIADINSGKGTMGKLLKDDALYNNLTKTSKELELLLQDVRLNPTRYINVSLFGKKNKPYTATKVDSLGVPIKK
ncbi:MlaD family protein [Flavobacterium sp. 3HN19-14]|uniref:MlaD family protein n=1 Tax=Flavobacterium sp. 3HN19-14 TaxID=3448133 RepID=UPI003EE13CD4